LVELAISLTNEEIKRYENYAKVRELNPAMNLGEIIKHAAFEMMSEDEEGWRVWEEHVAKYGEPS